MNIGDVREIEVQYPTECLTCEEEIPAGEWAKWCKGVGAWHVGCGAPRNLATYVKDAQRSERNTL